MTREVGAGPRPFCQGESGPTGTIVFHTCFSTMSAPDPKESFVQVEDLGTLMAVNVGWLSCTTAEGSIS